MNATIYFVGQWAVAIGCIILLTVITGLLFWLLGIIGQAVYKRLIKVYHLNVIVYWLARLEKEGSHCFQKNDTWNYKSEKDNKFVEKDIN